MAPPYFVTRIRVCAIALGFFALGAQAAVTEVVTDGTFASGLASWSVGASTGSASGSCGFNAAGVPGNEAITSLPGFTNAAGGPQQALGSVSLTANGFRSCVLYQDIAIPAGATTLSLSGDFAIKTFGGLATGDTAIFVGLYPTTSVPSFQDAFQGGNRLIVPGANNTAVTPRSPVTLNVAPYAGTTLRLAIINAMQSQASGTGPYIPGAGSVIGADRVSALVTVPLAAQTITFNNPGPQALGTSPTVTATASSGLAPSFTSATPGVCTITSGGALTLVAAGTCTINADQPGNATLAPAPQVTQTFAVVQATQTITFANPGPQTLGTTAMLTASASSGLEPGFTSATPGVCTITAGGTLTLVAAGTCTINADQSGNATFAPAPQATQAFAVVKATQTVTVANPGQQTMGTNPTLAATASSGLAPTFSSATTGVCTVTAGGTLTLVAAGSCTINANQAGDASYAAAPQVTQTFAVVQATQTITFANPGQQTVGTNPTLAATASSGLAPSFTSATPGVCTTTLGGALTLVGAGTCTINADQPGNATFAAAPQVARTFAVVVVASVNVASIPTLQTWALVVLAWLLAATGWTLARRN